MFQIIYNLFYFFSGFKFAGVEYSVECWCGSDLIMSRLTSEDRCHNTCSGDNTVEKCGGYQAIGIYTTEFGGKKLHLINSINYC